MKLVTLKQVKKVLELLEDFPAEQLQKLLESGLLSDLLNANVDDMMDRMNRNDFRKICGLVPISTEFPVWKTIKIGTPILRTAKDFRISDWAEDIMSKPDFVQSLAGANVEQEYDLVILSTAQLTGKGSKATIAEVFAGVKRLELEKCPAWIGTKLRSDYQDQPSGEELLIGMEPIPDLNGTLRVFRVERGGSELWLGSCYAGKESFWPPDSQWVFVLPRK